jgi:RND family efflux transporter MFP subunit
MTRKTLPVALLLGAAAVVALMALLRSRPEEKPPEFVPPLLRVMRAEPAPYQFVVHANGTVAPRSESDLVPQVSGEVVWVSPALVVGGFFDRGEALVRIDRADHEAALESANAGMARAASELRRARKERGRQRRLANRSVASESRIDDAENAFRVADASLRDARASLGRAERDLDRTELRAPYEGRVRSERVDLGQFVARGSSVASLYAVDYVEVRLPLPDRELAYLELQLLRPARAAVPDSATSAESVELVEPVGSTEAVETEEAINALGGLRSAQSQPQSRETAEGPAVRLRAEFAGAQHVWDGTIVRTEGELDPKSRMVNVVARIADPYAADGTGRPPLAVGLFVEAEILGRRVEHATLLPRIAMREGGRVYVIDDENRLRMREVELLRSERDNVVIGAGLVAGERVCISPLGAAIDGMRVRVVGDAVHATEVADRADRPSRADSADTAEVADSIDSADRAEALP